MSEKEITGKFIKAYNDVRLGLHADLPDFAPRVTETMDQIIDFIDQLIQAGAAYQVDGDVYFRVESDPTYGELSHQKIDDLMVGARIDANSKKENPLDFTLWKETNEGIQWDSPWSKGRPGWHTECVVMIQNVFQKPLIDIHGGGLDLKFPHHENEMAQCQALNHTNLANTWVHNGMINISGDKMSKSKGNVLWAKDLIAQYGGNAIRWMMISAHYRAPLNISESAIQSSMKELNKIYNAYKQAQLLLAIHEYPIEMNENEPLYHDFIDAMNDDLNTPNAIAVVFEMVKQLNQLVRTKDADMQTVSYALASLKEMLTILGIEFPSLEMSSQDIQNYKDWKHAVSVKDFEKADHYRSILQEKGIL